MNFILVFFEGLFSFFSPCVLPLIPLYIGYLSGQNHDDKKPSRKKLFLLTTCFIIGIFIAIFLLNISVQVISSFFKEYMTLMTRIGGILIIMLGLYQFGIIRSQKLSQTKQFYNEKTCVITIYLRFYSRLYIWLCMDSLYWASPSIHSYFRHKYR